MIERFVLVVACAWAVSTTACRAQSPSYGKDRVRVHEVRLALRVPAPCVALEADTAGIVIVLSRHELDAIAAVKDQKDEGEPARLAFIAGMRGRAMLAQLDGSRDARGCQVVQGPLPLDTRYLVGQLLEQGHAAVLAKGSSKAKRLLQVRHVDSAVLGWDELRLSDGTRIWGYGTWVV